MTHLRLRHAARDADDGVPKIDLPFALRGDEATWQIHGRARAVCVHKHLVHLSTVYGNGDQKLHSWNIVRVVFSISHSRVPDPLLSSLGRNRFETSIILKRYSITE